MWASLWYLQGTGTEQSLPVAELTIDLTTLEVEIELTIPDLEIEVD